MTRPKKRSNIFCQPNLCQNAAVQEWTVGKNVVTHVRDPERELFRNVDVYEFLKYPTFRIS